MVASRRHVKRTSSCLLVRMALPKTIALERMSERGEVHVVAQHGQGEQARRRALFSLGSSWRGLVRKRDMMQHSTSMSCNTKSMSKPRPASA